MSGTVLVVPPKVDPITKLDGLVEENNQFPVPEVDSLPIVPAFWLLVGKKPPETVKLLSEKPSTKVRVGLKLYPGKIRLAVCNPARETAIVWAAAARV